MRLVWAFLALLGLLGISVASAFLPLGEWGVFVGIGIAMIKAAIVVFAFMEIRRSTWGAKAAGMAGCVWLILFFCLIFADYSQR